MYPRATLKLARSASDQNVFLTYVCLVNDVVPSDHHTPETPHKKLAYYANSETTLENEDEHIKVERSKALHELVDSHRKSGENVYYKEDTTNETCSASPCPTTSGEESYKSETEDAYYAANPHLLKLTKMKWLTEEKEEAQDSSSPSISPTSSHTSSQGSQGSQCSVINYANLGDKYLSTIIRLDKEHNMFGLSNIAIVGSRTSKKIRKDKAVFHQTAIVQICCRGKVCCRHKSNTDLPSSLKCGGCRGCCIDPCCPVCVPYGPPCNDPPFCQATCSTGKCKTCSPSKCLIDCSTCFGLQIAVNRKPKYEPAPVEVTPRASSVLQKPLAARSCHHLPHCIPPSSCFPYLMPCFWPARSGAPCSNPARCFHNPPCMAPRKRKSVIPPEERCPRADDFIRAGRGKVKCKIASCPGADENRKAECKNISCPGNIPTFKKEYESKYASYSKPI